MLLQFDLLLPCLDLIHCAQQERGLTTLYLCSRGNKGKEDMEKSFMSTDAAMEKVRSFQDASPLPWLAASQTLPLGRAVIVELNAKAPDTAEWYSKELIVPAIDFVTNLILHNSQNIPARASALTYLVQWQERLSHEREMITQLAGQEWMHDEDFVSRLKSLIRERQTYERLFWGTVDDTQRQVCAPIKAAFGESRSSAVTGDPKALDKFAFFSARIDALHEAARKMAARLVDESAEPAPPAAGQNLDPEIEGHFDIIRSLPLFRGVNNSVLRELLRSARLVHHDKNGVFLTQGDSAGRFYAILDGWVKLYKSAEGGEETVLQLLGKRENVMECDLVPLTPSPASAKAVTKIKLLSIPVKVLRDYIVQNRELTFNVLMASSRRAQRLIGHFEQLTLKSAHDRVGYFLLNVNLETGIGGPPFILPFEKSLIAAYLGIKPETFSRILQSFRDHGFVIERQQIALPEPYALCDFCDSETAQKCDLAGTESCPRCEALQEKFG